MLFRSLLAKEAKVAFQQFCTPENIRRLKEGIRVSSGASVELDFQVTDQPMLVQDSPAPTQQEPKEHVSQPQRIRQAMGNPVIKKFIEVFESEVVKVDESPMSNQ